MKVLSLAWKYHPSITSGVGVACEGLNNALSKIVDLTVIYPKVSSVQIEEEVLLSSEDLSTDQRKQIEEEYIELVEKGEYELAIRLDPYFVSRQRIYQNHFHTKVRSVETIERKSVKSIKVKKIREKVVFDEVDVFGEFVRDKIFVYNRLVEELAMNLQFDVIHAHDWMTFSAGIALKDKYNKPLVLHVHSLEYDRVGHKDASWVYDIERFAMSKANKVITTSDYTKGIIESNYGLSQKHMVRIPNAITFPEHIDEATKKSNNRFRVLFAGRIDGNKGIEYLHRGLIHQVRIESLLRADRLFRARCQHGTLVNACRALDSILCVATKNGREQATGRRTQVADRAHLNGIQALLRLRPDTGNHGNGQRIQSARIVGRVQNGEAIRLVEIRGNLCNEFVCSDADRRAQPGSVEDTLFYLRGDLLR